MALLAITACRVLLGASSDLSPDETYYYLWSERPAASYYSKGPGVAAAIKISTLCFGKSALGVRIFSPFLGLGTSLLLYTLATSLFNNDRTGAWTVVILNVTPIFNAGSTLMTIDPLMIFFWSAAMLTFWRALHRTGRTANRYWLATGLLVGIGFLCKYTAALQLLSMVLMLGISRRWRGQLTRRRFYSALGVFLLCTLPVIYWNARHGWITVNHLKERAGGAESGGFHAAEFAEFFGMHLGVYSPLLFIGLLWGLYMAARGAFRDDGERFLAAFAFPILLMYFGLSFREAGEGNWTAPGFLSAGLLLAHYWDTVRLGAGIKRRLQIAALFIAGAMTCVTMHTDIIRQLGIRFPYKLDPSARLRGWQETAETVEDITASAIKNEKKMGRSGEIFLIANRWQLAAELAFYMRDDLPVIRPSREHPLVHTTESRIPVHQFSFWPRYDGIDGSMGGNANVDENTERIPDSPFVGKTALYVTDDADRKKPPSAIVERFEKFQLIRIFDILRGGNEVRRIKIFACYDYRPGDL